ncbi:MAG TPA: hypothetical protein VFE93_05945, partial [Myxococcaceae bacterium]|nr:hypothetical protein [Myxococcaceae bacterium]
MTRWVLAGLCVLAAGGLAAAHAQQKGASDPRVMPAEHIPSDSEAKLTDRMKRHGADLIELLEAGVLHHPAVRLQGECRVQPDAVGGLGDGLAVEHRHRVGELDQFGAVTLHPVGELGLGIAGDVIGGH